MNDKTAKDIMIPLGDYPIVDQNANIIDAIHVLEESHKKSSDCKYPNRAVLVFDENHKIIGKLGLLSILKSLEPNPNQLDIKKDLNKVNLDTDLIDSLMDNYNLWEDDFVDLRGKLKNIKVTEVMHPVIDHIDENTSLIEAVHKMISQQTLSILVSRKNDIIGIIRLSDLYQELVFIVNNSIKN